MVTVGNEMHDAQNPVSNPASIMIGRHFYCSFLFMIHPSHFMVSPLGIYNICTRRWISVYHLTTARGTPYCIDV